MSSLALVSFDINTTFWTVTQIHMCAHTRVVFDSEVKQRENIHVFIKSVQPRTPPDLNFRAVELDSLDYAGVWGRVLISTFLFSQQSIPPYHTTKLTALFSTWSGKIKLPRCVGSN